MLSRNEVKYIQSLYHKKTRDEEELFIAEGIKLTSELLHADFNIKKIYAVREWINVNATIENVIEVSNDDLKKISNFETPQQVLALVEQKTTTHLPVLSKKITLVLDGIQDPGNLGTIIRTADWFNIKNIIASKDTADVYNHKVVQSTMGSIARVNIFYTDLDTFLSNNEIAVYGAMLDGQNIAAIKKPNECLLVIGNESKGIRNNILPLIQHKITIAGKGDAESLNAAVATGILLYKLCGEG